MGIDFPLFAVKNFHDIVLETESFKKEELDERFCFVFPKLIHSTYWKYDYAIFERKDL